MRLYLLFHTSLAKSSFFSHTKRQPWEAEMTKRLESGIAGFSLTRYAPQIPDYTHPSRAALTLPRIFNASEPSTQPELTVSK